MYRNNFQYKVELRISHMTKFSGTCATDRDVLLPHASPLVQFECPDCPFPLGSALASKFAIDFIELFLEWLFGPLGIPLGSRLNQVHQMTRAAM